MKHFKFFLTAILAITLLGVSCKKNNFDKEKYLIGQWNTLNKDVVDVEAGAYTSVIKPMAQSFIKLPKTIILNEGGTGSFIFQNDSKTDFKYTKNSSSINIEATNFKLGNIDIPATSIAIAYDIDTNKELEISFDALNMVKAFLQLYEGGKYKAMAEMITKAQIKGYYKK